MNTGRTHFKKGHIPWNKGMHIKSNNALEIWYKNGGKTWCEGKHPWKDRPHPMLGKSAWNKGTDSRIEKICNACGNKFKIYPYRKNTALFCSLKCRSQHFSKFHIPWNKGKPFLSVRGNKSNFWKGGISRQYKDGYWSLKYKNWRREIFIRDSFTCKNCKKSGVYIEAHHIKSWADYPKLRFNANNGITLCKKCHSKTENYKGKNKRGDKFE